MEIRDKMPDPKPVNRLGLRTHQIRVLRALETSPTGLVRKKIAQVANISDTVTSRALGYENLERRTKFEKEDPCGGYPSLLTLGLVTIVKLDIDDVIENFYQLTDKGKKAIEDSRHIVVPPPRA